jgi:hypothetical protein
MQLASRDAALGRMEVWVDNDTAHPVRPRRIAYRDPRFRATLPGTRLRPIPSQSSRGFPIYLPPQPACGHPRGSGTISLTYGDTTKRIRVADSTDVVGRYTTSRCLELAIDEVAHLRWANRVPANGDGEGEDGQGSTGTLTLVVTPTGKPGPALRIDTISGTPVLSPVGTDVWRPDARITGTSPPRRIDLPLKPNRCDAPAFAESGGATAFKIGLHLGGKAGQITLRMSVPGARNAINYAKHSCGDLLTMS